MFDFTPYQNLSDEELLKLSLKHPSLFNVLLNRYQDKLYRRAFSLLQEDEEAKDAVQETFVSIYLHAGQFQAKSTASFSSWAYAITTNKCFTIYKKKRNQKNRTVPLSTELEALLASKDEMREHNLKDLACHLLSIIPKPMRRVLTLVNDGYSYEEIALQEKVSPSSIRSRVHRARKILNDVAKDLKVYM
ncbi:MAG: hypothetical protein A2571_00530 [Candidatus Vogelbacteria bacterium RIFOXYD1_FULL_44_32]|uniref:HTH luxR-type domain-containing protein n=1 Tax=Candidatus Vogelbacteria bacterium RIFOXYD1_FULL_44_32 TaxID=1802438 RepID=A0A1G2QEB4_9BACT|nr:MAG: hypothetical protein A2571_00530 [Candidatus Vogelbacteria bacterium RIFOXYD1_FULL_44_32]